MASTDWREPKSKCKDDAPFLESTSAGPTPVLNQVPLCMRAKWLQSCPTVQPYDCSPPDSSVHGILQARILEWVAIPFSRGSSPPRDRTHVSYISCIGRWVLYHWCHLGRASTEILKLYHSQFENQEIEAQTIKPLAHFSGLISTDAGIYMGKLAECASNHSDLLSVGISSPAQILHMRNKSSEWGRACLR